MSPARRVCRRLAGGAAVGLIWATPLCCANEGGSGPEYVRLDRYRVWPASEAVRLQLIKLGEVRFGSGRDAFVYEITHLAAKGGRYYVLDGYSKSVMVFDRAGRLLAKFGRPGRGPGELLDPFELAFDGGRIYVADPGQGMALSVFDEAGAFLGRIRSELPSTPTAIDAAEGRLFVLTSTLADVERHGWEILFVLDRRGRVLGRGCRLDPRYIASMRVNGMIRRNQYGEIAVRGGRVYCIQTITPVVQIMDRNGRALGLLDVAPPFYRAPQDQPATLNLKRALEFFSTWTAHVNFFPLDGGFASVYSRYEPAGGEFRYHLFACRERGGEIVRCGVAAGLRKPVLFLSPDTIYLEEEVLPNETARVGIYRVTGL